MLNGHKLVKRVPNLQLGGPTIIELGYIHIYINNYSASKINGAANIIEFLFDYILIQVGKKFIFGRQLVGCFTDIIIIRYIRIKVSRHYLHNLWNIFFIVLKNKLARNLNDIYQFNFCYGTSNTNIVVVLISINNWKKIYHNLQYIFH